MEQIKNTSNRIIIAIDGPCASGKSTLAKHLQKEVNAMVFRMDDFFLSEDKKTKERLNEIGGNVDYERFQKEVLNQLQNDYIEYRRFNCKIQDFEQPEIVSLPQVIVVEGSYSLHKELRDYYDIKILLKVNPTLQLKRLEERNPKLLNRFINEWIPLENRYFEHEKLEEIVDYIIDPLVDFDMEIQL